MVGTPAASDGEATSNEIDEDLIDQDGEPIVGIDPASVAQEPARMKIYKAMKKVMKQ